LTLYNILSDFSRAVSSFGLTDRGECVYDEGGSSRAEFARRRILPLAGKRQKLKFLRQDRPFLAEKQKFLRKKMAYNDDQTTGTPAEPTTTPEPATTQPAEETPAT